MTNLEVWQKILQASSRNLRVMMYTDHGQWPQTVTSIQEMYWNAADNEVYDQQMLEELGFNPEDLEKVLVLM